MTTGLERKAHRLVELARAGDDPSATQLLSLHGAVAARIAAEGANALAGAAATPKVAGAALVKGLVAAGALATAVTGFFVLRTDEPPLAPPLVAPLAPARALPPAPTATVTLPPPAPASVELPPPSRPSKLPAAGLRLQDEATLLAEVQGALRSGKPKLALGKLDAYDRRFPRGMLRAEAEAARVFALCASGSAEKARAFAERFVQRHPGSPAVARVQAACK